MLSPLSGRLSRLIFNCGTVLIILQSGLTYFSMIDHAEVEEEIIPSLHFLTDSPISQLALAILDSMGKEAIPEALGHNYPLFLADKRAKVAYEEATRSCVSAVDLEITKSRLDQQILFQGKFRTQRSGIESVRKKTRKPMTK